MSVTSHITISPKALYEATAEADRRLRETIDNLGITQKWLQERMAEEIGMTRQQFYTRMQKNSFSNEEKAALWRVINRPVIIKIAVAE